MIGSARDLVLAVADVAIVYYVLYRGLVLIKGTRAVQMAMGLGLILIVYYGSRLVGLVTLNTLLNVFWSSILLIVIVVFQHDVRRALMRVGRQTFFRAFSTAQELHVVEEVIRAATLLAQKRVGALIVFEREAALDEFIEEGTRLDATVSKELLYAIFIPSYENPMHDGAVIVRNYRVLQAGAFLPLSANPKLDRALGTRHRAAIGITEETDAVVVVVSEERGAISLCFGGNIVPALDAGSLRKALLGLFTPRPRGKKGARSSILPVAPDRPSAPSSSTPPEAAAGSPATTGATAGAVPDGEPPAGGSAVF